MPITLYFLQASRSIRSAWLLEELGVDYEIKQWDRTPNLKAPDEAKAMCGSPIGKFPTIDDNGVIVHESGAIAQYLCDKYDTSHRLLPRQNPQAYATALGWLHTAEGSFFIHTGAVLYSRWFYPKDLPSSGLEAMEDKMAINIHNDLDWLERELSDGRKFLMGEEVSVADTMMEFSLDYILKRKMATKGRRWLGIEGWLERCHGTETYKRAVEKTGHKL